MILVECPHCRCKVEILEINCAIFRHGIYKNSGEQINPHMSKIECDRLVQMNEIYGCGKPFRIIKNDDNDNYLSEICDYI